MNTLHITPKKIANSKPVRVFRNGILFGDFETVKAAAEAIGWPRSMVCRCLIKGNPLGAYTFEELKNEN